MLYQFCKESREHVKKERGKDQLWPLLLRTLPRVRGRPELVGGRCRGSYLGHGLVR